MPSGKSAHLNEIENVITIYSKSRIKKLSRAKFLQIIESTPKSKWTKGLQS
jgi:hypothetical protein